MKSMEWRPVSGAYDKAVCKSGGLNGAVACRGELVLWLLKLLDLEGVDSGVPTPCETAGW